MFSARPRKVAYFFWDQNHRGPHPELQDMEGVTSLKALPTDGDKAETIYWNSLKP